MNVGSFKPLTEKLFHIMLKTILVTIQSLTIRKSKHHHFFVEGKLELLDSPMNGFTILHQRHCIYTLIMVKPLMEEALQEKCKIMPLQ